MALGILRNGVPLDQLYGAKGASTAAATGLLQNGVDVNQYILALADGSPLGFNSGISKNGTDFSAIFGIPSGSSPLPINGNSYSADSQIRGSASLTFNMNSDGTYSIVSFSAQTGTTTPSSGTWLPSGQSVSSFSVLFSYNVNTASANSTGSNSVTNSAPTQTALTTSQSVVVKSTAPLTGDNADQNVTVTMKLYKSGVLQSTTSVTFNTNVNGN